MARIHFNNFSTTLNGAITNVATSITLNDNIPSLSGGTVYLTIYGGGFFEIISIASNTGAPTYTCTRGLEGTSGRAWADGSKIECRVTRDSIDGKEFTLSGASLISATVATDDKVLIQDTSNSDNLKTVTSQSVANLATPSTVISGASITNVSPATDDKVIIQDTSDSNNVKYVTTQSVANLATPTTVISGSSISTATVATDDKIIIQDTSDSNNVKTVTTQSVANLFAPALLFLTSHTASNSATLDFTGLGDYAYIEFVLNDLAPQTDGQAMTIRTSTDNGLNYDASSGNYSYAANGETSTPASGVDGSSSATYIKCSLSTGNSTNECVSGSIKMYNPAGTGFCKFTGQVATLDTSTLICITNFAGTRRTAADVDAVRFMFESGNIVSGTIYAYGMKKS